VPRGWLTVRKNNVRSTVWRKRPGGIRVVVEVTSVELHTMGRAHMNVDEARSYLGLKWSRAA
jgi:hypothetical protein